ncbi:MAG TPA: hypothetical protein QF813_06875 [Alphaproteobacteria bacterium]|nr:hypothetical protein [Alphaproteobacteria bacterium]
MKAVLAVAFFAGVLIAPAKADDHLTGGQMRELLAFAANAGFGFSLRPEHVQLPENMRTVYGSVGGGLRVLGWPCADVSHIEAPQSGSNYSVTCLLTASGNTTATYLVNAQIGIAREK